MCGINGLLQNDAEAILRMSEETAHRGPDGTRTLAEDGISLGHNRLAIIDLDSRSAQPMESADKRYVIVYNGELYNYRELKRALVDYPYRTEGDTEVILAAYAKWGVKCFERLSGIFALGIFDRHERTLTIARDPRGVKPLYYVSNKGAFAFSSELRSLLKLVPAELNHNALALYFDLLYTPEPHTLIDGVKKLGAGMYAVVKGDDIAIASYLLNVSAAPGRPTLEEIRGVIGKAVGAQLVSDRPVGVFLSGGFDSSIVLHHVIEHAGGADTFTTGFELPEREAGEYAKFNADMELARKTAQHYGTKHHEHMISLSEVRSSLEEVFGAVDEPIANSANVPTYHLSKFAREHVVVALDGSGGDEYFGGYDWYRLNRIADVMRRLPVPLQHIIERTHPTFGKMKADDAEYYLAFMGQSEKTLRAILRGVDARSTTRSYLRGRYKDIDSQDFLERMMHIHRTLWLVDESLTRTDKLGMAHGLEVRVPLLDTAVVELAARIPAKDKATFTTTKKPLKDAYRGVLPAHIYGQPKRGWFPPGAKWLRDPGIADTLKHILSPQYYRGTETLFDWNEVTRLFDEHVERRGYHFKPLWALATFQVWARKQGVKV